MKKILAIAVVLSALGTGIVFADDNTCVQITQGIGCAVGGYLGSKVGQGFQGCAVGTVIGTAVGNTVCSSSSSSGSTTDSYTGFEPQPGWDD